MGGNNLDQDLIWVKNQSVEWIVEIEGKIEGDKLECYINNINNHYAQFLKVEKEQIIGKNINYIKNNLNSIYYKIINCFFHNSKKDTLTIYINKKDDNLEILPSEDIKEEKCDLWEIVGYLQSKSSDAVRVLIIVKDINEELDYIKEKITMRDIKSYNHIIMNLSDVISNLSHAWRQPLNSLNFSIINFMDELEEAHDNKIKEEFYKEIWQIIKSLSREIEKFKAFFEMDYKKEIFDIKKYLDLVFEILDEKIKKENIIIDVHIQEKINKYGSPNEFLQIMYCVLFDMIEHCKNTFDIQDRKIDIQVTRDKKNIFLKMNIIHDIEKKSNYKLYINHLSMFKNIIHSKMDGTIDLINDGTDHSLIIGFPIEL